MGKTFLTIMTSASRKRWIIIGLLIICHSQMSYGWFLPFTNCEGFRDCFREFFKSRPSSRLRVEAGPIKDLLRYTKNEEHLDKAIHETKMKVLDEKHEREMALLKKEIELMTKQQERRKKERVVAQLQMAQFRRKYNLPSKLHI